jgi:hypothetical protein
VCQVVTPARQRNRRYLERETGLEPATLALARRCSTTELLPLNYLLSISAGGGRVNSTRRMERAGQLCVCWPPATGLMRTRRRRRALLQQMAIPDMQNAVADRGCLRIVRDHEHGLLELLVGAPQHGEHDV